MIVLPIWVDVSCRRQLVEIIWHDVPIVFFKSSVQGFFRANFTIVVARAPFKPQHKITASIILTAEGLLEVCSTVLSWKMHICTYRQDVGALGKMMRCEDVRTGSSSISLPKKGFRRVLTQMQQRRCDKACI